ncbi:cation-transporting ATPase [Acrasis kona]|uniref:Cation-transporting ATPase n=1 Tax=Acrasis kona TaxID=1008807 RepID=A0AAW2YW66_9EUKA
MLTCHKSSTQDPQRQYVGVGEKNVQFFSPPRFNTSIQFDVIVESSKSQTSSLRSLHSFLFGINLIDIPVKNYFALLVDEILHPFYIFQLVSIIIWLSDEYFIYALAIFFISTTSAFISLFETRRNLIKLSSTAKYSCDVVRIDQAGLLETTNSITLVPGDIIEISDQLTMPCDCVVISGQVVVNEAMLTGESVPVTKIPIPSDPRRTYSIDNDRNHTLYAGTSVLQTRTKLQSNGTNLCTAMVLRTGFASAKGKLMLSILYPKPTTFKFYEDSLRFIGFMFLLGGIGIIFSVVQLKRLGVPTYDLVLRALDVITIAVPPALPLAMTVGTSFALSRLRNHNKIYCISPPRVNVSGQIKLMCFDKTGTLTEEGLDLSGVRPIMNQENNSSTFCELIESKDIHSLQRDQQRVLHCLATCHGLTHVRGELVGDPLEVKIFQSTQWSLKEPEHFNSISPASPDHDSRLMNRYDRICVPPRSVAAAVVGDDEDEQQYHEQDLRVPKSVLAVVRTFDFKSDLQRMSVLVKDISKELSSGSASSHCDLYVKGSPEKIFNLCIASTIPHDFQQVLNHYAHQGFRVLAMAHKSIKQEHANPHATRESYECDLSLLGLILMCNEMKSDTLPVMKDLLNKKIKCVMVTGDNPLTAISVARQCNMVPKSRVFLGNVDVDHRLLWKDVDDDTNVMRDDFAPSIRPQDSFELAVTGQVFNKLLDDHYKNNSNELPLSPLHVVLSTCNVFARMTPDDKLRLVEEFIKLGYFVGMCGDGANDCGALKAAHVGVSLSEAEASVAAPFTSLIPTIACVPNLIREGRAALATSFQMFKYMACYSLLQFFTVICLYQINSNFGDYQFLFVDTCVVLPTIFLMSRTDSNRKLVRSRPPATLVSRTVFASLAWHLISAFVIQVIVMFDVRSQRFYRQLATSPNTKQNIATFECTALFSINIVQSFAVAFVYSISRPFKKPVLTNRVYAVVLVLLSLLLSYVIMIPDRYTIYWLELVDIPIMYRVKLLCIGIGYLVISYAFERLFIVGVFKSALNVLSPYKMMFYYKRYVKRNARATKSRKAYNILKNAVDQYREERANASLVLQVDQNKLF